MRLSLGEIEKGAESFLKEIMAGLPKSKQSYRLAGT